jgi:hypothetical protein
MVYCGLSCVPEAEEYEDDFEDAGEGVFFGNVPFLLWCIECAQLASHSSLPGQASKVPEEAAGRHGSTQQQGGSIIAEEIAGNISSIGCCPC